MSGAGIGAATADGGARAAYDLRPYREGDEHGILASFNQVFREVCGEGYVDRDLATWAWIYDGNPAGKRVHVAIAPDGTVAGHYGGTPQRARSPFGPCTIVHAIDSFVVAAHRRGLARPGLFVNLAQPWFDACREGGDVMIYGYPVEKAMRIGQKYLGYTPMRRVDYLLRPVGEGRVVGPGGVEVEEVDRVPGEIDALQERVTPSHALAVEKSHAYLTWRYAEAPDPSVYALLAARRAGTLVGFCVLRRECGLVPDTTAFVDVVADEDDRECMDALIAHATAVGRAQGTKSMMGVFPPWCGFAKALGAEGFVAEPSTTWMERTLSHNSFVETMPTDWLREHWLYALGDSDFV